MIQCLKKLLKKIYYAIKLPSFAQPKAAARQRSIVANGLLEATEDTFAYQNTTPTFSIDLDTGHVSNQKQSGRSLDVRRTQHISSSYR